MRSISRLARIVTRAFGLQARLLLITALVLTTCLGAAGWVLDRTHKDAVRTGAKEQLLALAYGLLSTAEELGDGLSFRKALGEPRLGQPDSGLYAFVERADGSIVWRSPSMLASGVDTHAPLKQRPAPGESVFERADSGAGADRFVLAYTVIWETLGATEVTFWVLADRRPYRDQILEFRRNSTIGLASAAVIFIVIQFAALRWGLAPVRRMAGRIRGIEAGRHTDIGDDYPRELSGLARNVNRFIAYEKDNRERYRRAMDDLAHSLKTPLAVLKNAMRELNGSDAGVIRDQVDRMQTTVTHQLSRAAAVRTVLPKESVPVMAVAARVAHALERAYADKRITTELADSDLAVRVDERDLLEMLGNLIENAFKYTRSRVRISTRATDEECAIVIEDDGDGIDPADRELVVRRGTRADTASAGHGIGLAVAVELAAVYDGGLTIEDSELGGALVRLRLPTVGDATFKG
ncbi:MAG: two-component sensor histidine kinase [Gammaproteobacteria bacterium]|nr:two-component sensor histidine kinase [Gammaproteobacteria bacterium]